MKSFFVLIIGILSAIYMVYPSFGVLEFIPDNIPFVGNLDEATAMAVLLSCARYFGFDLSRFFGRKGEGERDIPPNTRVIDVDKL